MKLGKGLKNSRALIQILPIPYNIQLNTNELNKDACNLSHRLELEFRQALASLLFCSSTLNSCKGLDTSFFEDFYRGLKLQFNSDCPPEVKTMKGNENGRKR
ncbi:hypothetical protein M9H77_18470 [Catharanthus roseus]|uniref:Uncharacterized protein n=1 Tax=Catharanthus roseus TaxID=4058 RepID=A0ACC0B7R2_CATRO|nr:hypothetical protein M9H77_18470 [Catharanthus roseus]